MDTTALGQDLMDLGGRLSNLKGDAVQGLSRQVQNAPAGAVVLALGVGAVFGFLLGFVSHDSITVSGEEAHPLPRTRRRRAAGHNGDTDEAKAAEE